MGASRIVIDDDLGQVPCFLWTATLVELVVFKPGWSHGNIRGVHVESNDSLTQNRHVSNAGLRRIGWGQSWEAPVLSGRTRDVERAVDVVDSTSYVAAGRLLHSR